MRTQSEFFALKKIPNIHNSSFSTKYSQLPTFHQKNTFFNKNKSIKEKENKRYILNTNKIPLISQKNIKTFSLNKKSYKLKNNFLLSNSNFYNTDSLVKSNNISKEKKLSLNEGTTSNGNFKYSSRTIPKNNNVYKIKGSNSLPFSKPKPNLKKIKLSNNINALNNTSNINLTSLKLEIKNKNLLKNNNNINHININHNKLNQESQLQNILNEKYLLYFEAKHSSNSFDLISAYGVNTYKGIIRNYNEDRVSIIVNAKKPHHFKEENNSIWPNVSIFGIFDGHAGNLCAEYLKNNLHNYIIESPYFPFHPLKSIHEGFKLCEKNYIESTRSQLFNQFTDYSGSCAIIVLIIDEEVYIANLGDSRAIYSYNTGHQFFQLSRDHKPNDPKEKKRIYKAGGTIFKTKFDNFGMPLGLREADLGIKIPYRINPGKLAVSTLLII